MLKTEPYLEQRARWPKTGRHILAHFDDESVVVYQAYRPAIAGFAVAHGRFGGEFSYTRMSWIKPNFLWMMFRSGWGTKPGQEVTLAIRVRRSFFDGLLAEAVASTNSERAFPSRDDWQRAVRRSSVRLQWDPDHGPTGGPLQRRAPQLGLRGEALMRYGHDAILEIVDLSSFVGEQRDLAGRPAELQTPSEHVYLPADPAVRRRLGLAAAGVS